MGVITLTISDLGDICGMRQESPEALPAFYTRRRDGVSLHNSFWRLTNGFESENGKPEAAAIKQDSPGTTPSVMDGPRTGRADGIA